MIDLTEVYEPHEPTWTWERIHQLCDGGLFSVGSFVGFVCAVMPSRYAFGNDGIYLVEGRC